MRIAFSGVFDLKNYGDHLFYILFEQELEHRKIDCTLDLYSTFAYEHQFYGERKIYALKDLEKRHLETPYDAIIVGGGGIINLLYSEQKLDLQGDEFIKYSFGDLWVIPALVADKYGIPCMWNAPEVPNPFTDECKEFVKAVCSSLDYISVRDEKSKQYLTDCKVSKETVFVVPDTALIVHKYFEKETLQKMVKETFGIEKPFLVFHANRWIPKESFKELERIFQYAQEAGYETVFLPLAYTHADDEILKEVKGQISVGVHMFEKELNAYEMLGILACASMYIGVSFHGAVTSLQYGNKAMAYDYMHNKKMENLFRYFDNEQYYVCEYEHLFDKAKQLLSQEVNHKAYIEKAEQEIETHFDKMFRLMDASVTSHKKIENLITVVSRSFDETNFSIMNYEKETHNKAEEIAHLKSELQNYGALVDNYKKDLEEVQKLMEYYKESSEQFEASLHETQDLMKYFKETSEGLEKALRQSSEKLADATQELDRIKSKKAFKVIQKVYKDL